MTSSLSYGARARFFPLAVARFPTLETRACRVDTGANCRHSPKNGTMPFWSAKIQEFISLRGSGSYYLRNSCILAGFGGLEETVNDRQTLFWLSTLPGPEGGESGREGKIVVVPR